MQHFAEDIRAKDIEAPSETDPLLDKRTSFAFDPVTGDVQEEGDTDNKDAHFGIKDAMTYSVEPLTNWQAFSITQATVWCDVRLWKMMIRLSVVALTVAISTVLVVPNPAAMKVAKFTEVSKFLNVVVGLLLGFFMSSSMNRWHSCVNGFLQLLDAIRSLQLQFIALGVPEAQSTLCLRYGFASAWLLYGQLIIDSGMASGNSQTERELMWSRLGEKVPTVDRTGKSRLIEKREMGLLKETRDPALIIWTWIAALIGRLAQDGWIPPMPSPTYGRILNLCNNGFEGIRQVRASIAIQAPLSYTHMMATLVHINNLLNAVTFGIVSGLAVGTTLLAHGFVLPLHHKNKATMQESEQDGQNMLVTFMYCFFGPMIYQALLLISLNLAQPFASESAKIPMDRLLHQLEIDVCNGRDLADHMEFEKPYFKAPPPPPAPAEA